MMNSSGKKSRAEPLFLSLFLSLDDLPSDLVDQVLVRMPLRDAVRTSILSRRWRYRWATVTQLEFGTDSHRTDSELQNIIDRVLMLHMGPIHTFKVVANRLSPAKVDHWLIFLSRNGIKKLVLNLYGDGGGIYTVHSCVFCCQSITCLNLLGCTVKLPSLFEGFANLRVLRFEGSRVSEGDFQRLISNCSLLEVLVLVEISGCDRFEISSRSLRFLLFEGEFADFCFVQVPVLSVLSIELMEPVDFDRMREKGIFGMSKILACADMIEKLKLLMYSAAFLGVGCKPEKLPVVFERLQSIQLSISFTDVEESSLLISLLRSSPYLRELDLSGGRFDVEVLDNKIWEMSEDMDAFPHLRFLNFMYFSGIKPEMEFVKYVLGHAPVLQRMEIRFDVEPLPSIDREQVSIQLRRFQRASTQAEIICIE